MPDETNLRELKIRAQKLKPIIRLGKAGITPEFLAAFKDTFQHAALVKLRFEHFKDERKAMAKQLAEQSGAQLVQQVGHTAVFYRVTSKTDSAES
ncbi:hypothetical protein BH09VER1_BH09VER1_31560 [soil metagenome]